MHDNFGQQQQPFGGLVETSSAECEPVTQDAIALLRQGHRHLEQLLTQIKRLDRQTTSSSRVRAFAAEMTVVALVEDRVFYRGLQRAAPFLRERVARARRELVGISSAAEALHHFERADVAFDEALDFLHERLRLHRRRNAFDVYPAVLRTPVDLRAMGAAMSLRMQELRAADVLPVFGCNAQGR